MPSSRRGVPAIRVLLIEDDAALCESLRQDLTRAGFAVDVAHDGETGEFLGATEAYDLAVLDLGLPKLSGLEVLRRWRAQGVALPVLVLTARDAWYERVDGFKAGADDYLGKPFHVEELVVRLLALAKRRHGQAPAPLQKDGLRLDEERQCVVVDGARTECLTAVEFRLLRCFMLHSGQVLSKTHLAEHVYGAEDDPDSNVIEVYVNRLRRKLGKDLIATRRGQGYVFDGRP
jgi:two-component system OmpR family response regulator